MLKTIVFFLIMWIVLLLSTLFLIPFYFMKIFHVDLCSGCISKIVKLWAKFTLWTTGSSIKISGKAHFPKHKKVAFVGNHQSNMDIPIMLGYTRGKTGFLAKKELKKVPFISQWMELMGCVFINRRSVTSSYKAFSKTIMAIKQKQSMIIFPEGTRSQSNKMNPFKEGILRLVMKENIPIIPFTLINSHQTFERHSRIRKAKIKLIFHPEFSTLHIPEEATKEKIQELWQIIQAPLINHQ